MRRAVTLIITLSVLCVGLGLWMDLSQQGMAESYLEGAERVRVHLEAGDSAEALAEQARLHDSWQRDAHWLNCLVSHHHTRAVSLAMVQLRTALRQGWDREAWQALDLLEDALRDVEGSDFPYWENIL